MTSIRQRSVRFVAMMAVLGALLATAAPPAAATPGYQLQNTSPAEPVRVLFQDDCFVVGLFTNSTGSAVATSIDVRDADGGLVASMTRTSHPGAGSGEFEITMPGDGTYELIPQGTQGLESTSVDVTGCTEVVPQIVRTCGGVEATIVGTPGNDELFGTAGADVIAGLGGNDIIRGMGGDDILCGGFGDDQIYGGSGFDIIFGAQGNDLIVAASDIGANDVRGARMFGGKGNDEIHGTNRWDRMQGGEGQDSLYGYAGRDWIRGGPDNDVIRGGSNIDNVHGGSGNDTIYVDGQDSIRGGAGKLDRCIPVGATEVPISARSCELRGS